MKKILTKYLLKSEFAKNTFTLTIGTSVAQAFPIIFYPILGRIYTPVEFGLLATLTSITTILAVIATGKYESSIVITDSKKDGVNVIGLVLILSLIFLILSFIILQIFSVQVGIWLSEPKLKKWLFVCPISAYVIIIFNCYNEWCVRNKYFKRLSWNKIINSSSITLSKLLLGIYKIFSAGLVVGDLIGRTISAGGCVFRALQMDKFEFKKISRKQMQKLAKRYIEFPKFSLSAQLINTIGFTVPVLIIGANSSSKEVGYYAMTMNVLSIPISIISIAIRDVFKQRANEEYIRTGSCLNIVQRLLKILIFWGMLGSSILFFVLPDMFSIVLGKEWRVAGEYSQILLPMVTANFIAMALSGVLIVTENLRIIFFWQIYYAIITITSLLIGFKVFHDIKISLICFSVGRCTAYIIYIILAYKYSKGNIKNE
ncbi:MAG: lipopolysaccharide biosynthesis protein [Candidatus Odinarchaeota archaeon]